MTEGASAVAGSSTGAGGDSNSAAGGTPRVASSFVKFGDRTRFTVELRPGETTIVSWKKLMKDAAKAEGGGASSASAVAVAAGSTAAVASPEVPAAATATATAAVPSLEARLAPGQPAANEDAPAPNRFSAVIEKIERLYMGNSSDEEDLDGIPADDQYDTEDSFIDDHELDEYFQVDKSKTKHDGYFVNRGTLEKVNEPPESVNPQPKKRKRKELAKTAAIDDDSQHPSKQIKAGRKGTGKAISAEKGVFPTSVGPSVNSFEEIKFKNHQKIPGDGNPLNDPLLRISHDDGSLTLRQFSNNQNTGVFLAKKSKKMKEASSNGDRTESVRKSHSLKSNFEDSEIVAHQNDKSAIRERIDLNLPDTKHLMQPVQKNSVTHKKEGSSKSKANVLERAIRELEKMVAESRPPAPDAADGDFSSQSIKRRLPREIKQKLARVARLSHASNGKVSKELLSRLMGILGHLIQVRTLKRHLKTMMTMSLSAKQEKDDRFQLTKKEVIEMVKVIFPSSLSKATELQSGGSGDVQESSHSEKAAKGQLVMDATLEDKICDLYDIFVDGLDEDAAPQVRKLYAELAELWPKGVMDNHGIKRAICRAKERRRTLNEKNKEQEKMMKVGLTNTEDGVHVESNPAAQPQYVDVRVSADPNLTVATQQNKVSSSASYAAGNALIPMNSIAPAVTSSTNVPKIERPKQEKVKGTHNSSLADTRMFDGIGMDVKKKVKKRAENLIGDAHIRTEKLASHQGDDRQKQYKHPAASAQGAPHKSNYGDLRFEPLT